MVKNYVTVGVTIVADKSHSSPLIIKDQFYQSHFFEDFLGIMQVVVT